MFVWTVSTLRPNNHQDERTTNGTADSDGDGINGNQSDRSGHGPLFMTVVRSEIHRDYRDRRVVTEPLVVRRQHRCGSRHRLVGASRFRADLLGACSPLKAESDRLNVRLYHGY